MAKHNFFTKSLSSEIEFFREKRRFDLYLTFICSLNLCNILQCLLYYMTNTIGRFKGLFSPLKMEADIPYA